MMITIRLITMVMEDQLIVVMVTAMMPVRWGSGDAGHVMVTVWLWYSSWCAEDSRLL